jgi:ABC-2 type transport system permease protein
MITATFRTELQKQFLRVRTYVTFGFVMLIPLLITLAVRYGDRGQAANGDGLFALSRGSGLVLPAAALLMMSRFLLVVVVAIFAGDAIAGEATWGNLRYLLVRPIGRSRLLGAKLATALVLMLCATLLIVATGLAAGGLAFGIHPLDVPVIGIHQSIGALLVHLGIASAYVAWHMVPIIAIALMVSTMTDNPTGAIGAGVGLSVVSQILDAIPQLGALRSVLPTHYLDDWRLLIVQGHMDGDMWRGVLLQIPYILVFCAIAFAWFRRKDVLS